MTVCENVAYPLRIRGRNTTLEKPVDGLLEMLRINDLKHRYPYLPRGGEQQTVTLAMALIYNPAVLLLDEPFSNLDTPLRQRLRDELKLVQRETGITMIYVTHHRIEALSLGDRLMVLSNGRLMTTGSPTELFETLQT